MSTDSAALPKYLQLSELLIREVAAGRLSPGDRLPPERQMAEQLGVAVGTLRKALARLAEQGVVEAIQGSGNYIKGAPQGSAIYAFFRLERLDGGGLPRARLLSVETHEKPDRLPAFGTSSRAHRIRRLRLLDDQVVAAEEIWLEAEVAPDLQPEGLSESLYHFYRQKLGLWITATEDRVGLGTVPDWAGPVGLPEGAACGCFDRVSFDAAGGRPEVSTTWFNPERAVYVARSRAQSDQGSRSRAQSDQGSRSRAQSDQGSRSRAQSDQGSRSRVQSHENRDCGAPDPSAETTHGRRRVRQTPRGQASPCESAREAP